MNATATPGWTTPEEERAKRQAYENELIRRYVEKLPMTMSDRQDARNIIRARKQAEDRT